MTSEDAPRIIIKRNGPYIVRGNVPLVEKSPVTQITNIWKMIEQTDDTAIRSQVIAMVERCPSGALEYSIEPYAQSIEPDLPVGVSVTTDGPLWVSGEIAVEMSNGDVLEVRNRVTLCRCGASTRMPLCDGSHKEIGFSAPQS